MLLITSFIAGLIFGIGLIISGMTNPAKVLGFLDIAGKWDPSLVFVMLVAIAIAFFAFRVARKQLRTILGEQVRLPTASKSDRQLILGAVLFGVGWGLTGYCPGPALASIATGNSSIIFTAAMLAGMAIHEVLQRTSSR